MKAFILDMDGTLIDSVYTHTLAWQQAFAEAGIVTPAYEIHRRIGMSGRLLARAVTRQGGRTIGDAQIAKLDRRHATLFKKLGRRSSPLPGACDFIRFLLKAKIPFGIATTGKRDAIEAALKELGIGKDALVVDGDAVDQAKPEPDLFLACQQRLGVSPQDCVVVGDAVWDIHAATRAGLVAVGLQSGGTSEQDLYNAGALRVYRDAKDLLQGIDDLGLEV